MNAGSLFSGIGGLDLGLERAGMTIIWQCENDPYAARVLARHWPDVPNLGDITTVDWSTVERPDLICGGFPCQPASNAGRQLGIDDERWLWPEFARAVRCVRPRFVLVENVPGLLTVNDGRAMAEVLGDLAALGYDTEWECVPAAAVGAPHLRWRVFIVAHAQRDALRHQPIAVFGRRGTTLAGDDGLHRAVADPDDGRQPWDSEAARRWSEVHAGQLGQPDAGRCGAAVADPDGPPREQARPPRPPAGARPQHRPSPQPGGLGRGDRRPATARWPAEPDVGRVAHGVPHRVDRLRTLGNAAVPQVAELIGRRIIEAAT